MSRRTKIVATLGPATDDPHVLREMMRAGVDGVRINCSHGTKNDWLKRASGGRKAADRALLDKIRVIYSASRGAYGSPRVLKALRKGLSIWWALTDGVARECERKRKN